MANSMETILHRPYCKKQLCENKKMYSLHTQSKQQHTFMLFIIHYKYTPSLRENVIGEWREGSCDYASSAAAVECVDYQKVPPQTFYLSMYA